MSDVQKSKLPSLGDIMRLKSGGPSMTVTGLYPAEGLIYCRWFWRGRLFRDEFQPEFLEAAEPDR